MKQKALDALASAIYVSRRAMAGQAVETDDQRIRASGLYQDWTAGKHAAGDVYNAMGQTWECHADYDNAEHPDVTPGSSAWPTFNRPLHGRTRETARPWVKPSFGTTDIYKVGECMIWTDGEVYRNKRDTNFSPEEYPGDWEREEM